MIGAHPPGCYCHWGIALLIRTGKVYLVGAGPGHPELLTVKAAELLKTADVVVYDRLIQEEVLALAKISCERIYMGKPLGKHESRQQEIEVLLVRKAREGKMVVRLKGGDPYLFGRGGEEAEYLAENQVPFEVIPGVSSALAAPLSAGIAVTHRDAASSVAIITGHEASKDESRMNWDALGKLDTLVFLMGVHNVERIAEQLVVHGRSASTPAAMIQKAFWPQETVVTGTLETIAAEVERIGIEPPATLVVGDVVRLREKLRGSPRELDVWPAGRPLGAALRPDQLLRMAMAGLGSQVLGFALSVSLFDTLEEWQSAALLAARLGMLAEPLREILESLVAMGLLERNAEGYRNLELASTFLRSGVPKSLKSYLMHQLGQFSRWEAVAAYARSGQPGPVPVAGESSQLECCECLATFSAPAVVKRLDLAEKSPVLLLGWGADAYRSAVAECWPGVVVESRNPMAHSDARSEPVANKYGAVLLSGLVASSPAAERLILESSVASLKDDGVLILHDAFLPSGALPPEVVLGALARRLTCRPGGNWSIEHLHELLGSLGLDSVRSEYLPGGTVLVIARKASRSENAP